MNNQIDISKLKERIKNPKINISVEKLEEIRKSVYESLSVDRQRLSVLQPFTGGILMRMELIPIRDYRCATAMTDGNSIFFDMDFYSKLNNNERKFVLAHEVWHVIYMHFLRKQQRNSILWNIATDCEINYMLKHEGFQSPPDVCYPDTQVEGKNSEEIYEYLLKKQENDNNKNNNNKNNNKSSSINKGGTQKSNKLSGQFDEHVGEEQDGLDGILSDQWGDKGEDPNFTPMVKEDAAERIREMVISEVQRYERTQGKLPDNINKVIQDLRFPTISWREYLSMFVTKSIGDKRVWLPPNRHHVWSGLYFQSRRSEKIQVIVTIDTSGSTERDLPQFMAELISLLKTFGDYEILLCQCDAEVHDMTIYNDSNPFPIDDISDFVWKGFGGSDFRPAFKKLAEQNFEASCHIVITDGYINFPTQNPLGIPTLVVLTKDGNENCCSWADKIKIK